MDLDVVPPWIPEDDLLLKNAVEAGASLESLAKGAVRFSRRYSLTELQDRWRSLLYDPDVSAEAAASISNLELLVGSGGSLAKSGGNGTREGSGEGAAGKRKVPSVRKQYYAVRKRLCSQVLFDSLDMALHDEMCIEKNVDTYDERLVGKSTEEGSKVGKIIGVQSGKIDDDGVSLVQGNLNKDMNQLLVNNLVGCGNYSGLEDVGPSHSMSDVPLWKTIEDVSAPAMPVQVSLENKNNTAEAREMLPHGLKGKCAIDVSKASAAMSGEDVTHLSDSLLNLTNEDELVFMDVDGKDAADKPCYDNVDSLLLSSPIETQGNDASDICEARKLDTETKLAMPSSLSAAGLEVVANPLDHIHGDLHSISDPVDSVHSPIAAQSPHPEHSEEFMICLLNTEDPDIPSNDGTDLSIVVPLSVALKSQPIVKEVGCSDSSINNQRKNEPDGSLKKEDIPLQSLAASQIGRSGLVPDVNSSHPPVVVKTENPGRNPICAVSGQSNNANINPSHSRLVCASMTPALDGRLKQQEIDAPASAKVYAHPKAVEHKGLRKSDANPLSPSLGGDDHDDDDNDDEHDNDDDIPYFSDAETMVLEMDLCPSDQDTNASREVLRSQHEETKRTIMRLEQCAQSFMRRAIASQDALAVLYGRKLKQYIKKREVMLGRATDDFQVDIDLGREGRANKISRRQVRFLRSFGCKIPVHG